MKIYMEKILIKIKENARLYLALLFVCEIICYISVSFAVIIFARAFLVSLISFIKLILILLIPFITVSVLRKKLKRERPCDVYPFYNDMKKKKSYSFPSRHAHSYFAIATVLSFLYPYLSPLFLLLGLALCLLRVLLGFHFPKDVIAGALTGTVSSLLGVLILNPF